MIKLRLFYILAIIYPLNEKICTGLKLKNSIGINENFKLQDDPVFPDT